VRDASSTLTIAGLMQQWRTPLGYEPSYRRFMQVLRHLGLTTDEAVTEDGQAKIEVELLSRKWVRQDPELRCRLLAAKIDADLAHATELLDLAKHRLFWQRLELEAQALGGDPGRARAVVEYLITSTGCSHDRAKQTVIDALTDGRELAPPGNS
jgi:hypothetical protein